MVAETLPQTRPKKPHGFQSRIPLPQKLKARSLYILQQLSPQEIGNQLGLSRQQVQNLIYREKWTPLKQRAKAALEEKHDARIKQEFTEIHEAVALKAEELSVGIGEKASETLLRSDPMAARDLQAYTQSLKNSYGVARQARGLDTQGSESKGQTTVVFLGDLPRVERRAEQVIEVRADPQPIPSTAALPSPKPVEAPKSTEVIEDTGSGVGQQATD